MQKVIIDTDIGDDIDDAFAIALAESLCGELEIVGITTVFRNAKRRANMVKALLNEDSFIPVAAGIDLPLIEHIHSRPTDKYDGGGFVPCQYANEYERYGGDEKENAVDFIISQADKYNGELIIVPIGPLTNIATALKKDNRLAAKLKKIVLMGGYSSKCRPEWNILCDPEAARIVYTSGVPVYTVGLDVTMSCTLDGNFLDKLSMMPDKKSRLLTLWLERWNASYKFDKNVMHDPLVIASLVTDCVGFTKRPVKVELEGEFRGVTKLIPDCSEYGTCEVYVADKVRPEMFYDLMYEKLLSAEKEKIKMSL